VLTFVTRDAKLLAFDAAKVRPQGRTGGGIAGYETIPNGTRLYEPGRSFWAKFKVHF